MFGILRDEFDYTGNTVTDAGGQPNTYMTTDLMLRKDGALTFTSNGTNGLYDTESTTAIYYLKDATKHILYNKANSNIMQGIALGAHVSYTMSPWRIWLYTGWGVIGGLIAVDAVFIALIAFNKIKIKENEVKVSVNGIDEEEV